MLYMKKLVFHASKQQKIAAAVITPVLIITVPAIAFGLIAYISNQLPLHVPSGAYREVLNVRQVTDRKLFDSTTECFARRGLPHRVVHGTSVQVQESLFRTSIERCWRELNNAKLSTHDPEWLKTQQFWHGR